MHIAATILSGNTEVLIAPAIHSVSDWVDRILLIDTGITDDTLRIGREQAGAKLLVEALAWTEDFAQARNFALATAAALGASWALTIDTDERLSFPGFQSPDDLQRGLNADPDVLVWLWPCRYGSYAKERFIRVPTHLVLEGTHARSAGRSQRDAAPDSARGRVLRGAEDA